MLHLNNTSTILNYSSIPRQPNPLMDLTQAKDGVQTVRGPQPAIKNPRKPRNPRKSGGPKILAIAKLRKNTLSKSIKNQVKECKRRQPETVNQNLTNTTPFMEVDNVVNHMNEKLTEKEVKKMFYLAMDGVMRQGSRLTRSSFYKHIWHLPEDCKEEYLPVRVQGHEYGFDLKPLRVLEAMLDCADKMFLSRRLFIDVLKALDVDYWSG